jgi:hypothetical protein
VRNKNFLFILILVLFASCSTTNTSKEIGMTEKVKQANLVVGNFYRWYLDSLYENSSIYGPTVVQRSDSVFELNGVRFLSLLENSGFVSSNFVNVQKNQIENCNAVLVKPESQSQFKEAGFLAIQSTDCSFMNYYPWVGGQGEKIAEIKILSSEVVSDEIHVRVRAVEVLLVKLIKEKDTWVINEISIVTN